jgi:mycobactin polyketide synthetase MbtD
LDCGLLDNVVITGGSGTIGLAYARYLADRGAARIVLLSRRGADPTAIAALRSQGVDVVAPQCDITDPERVAATADAFAGDGASLLIHAAGTAAFATRGELTADAFADMAAAKLTGLTHLSERWPLRSDARILLCSSVIGVWGGKGVVGYAAANRMLDAMAGRLRARGLHCIAVRWGLWEGSDIVDAAEMARVERSGLRPMPPMPAIEASLRDHPHDPLVLSADADRLGLFFGSQRDDATAATDAGIGFAEAVRAELASVLTVADGALDLNSSLFDLGVDSLLALELRKRIKRAIGHTVPLATLLGGITGVELVADLEREFSRD